MSDGLTFIRTTYADLLPGDVVVDVGMFGDLGVMRAVDGVECPRTPLGDAMMADAAAPMDWCDWEAFVQRQHPEPEQCSNCRYGGSGGRCRRSAPVMAEAPFGYGVFPRVSAADWCGEYEPEART